MHDNKVRLSPDVLEKAEQIATEWGLKNVRAAVEAVFRCYADDYLYGRADLSSPATLIPSLPKLPRRLESVPSGHCEALDALDDLLSA